ncbi:MAG: EscU/YscU/HrcU family type III secretion system export apparatus switch protein, partial [Spirochaetes bacterium]|nr:EscU/YscU/HrcU family type III secretion system export apparatus switch protein [Spirochaetota bacterium]
MPEFSVKKLNPLNELFFETFEYFQFDLQLFAAEDEGRTEEPTEYKKRRARDEGKVVKTQELPSALVLLFGFFLIFIISKSIFKNMLQMMEYFL